METTQQARENSSNSNQIQQTFASKSPTKDNDGLDRELSELRARLQQLEARNSSKEKGSRSSGRGGEDENNNNDMSNTKNEEAQQLLSSHLSSSSSHSRTAQLTHLQQ